MKKLLSVILTLVLMCSLLPAAHAATDEADRSAQVLYELGLFRGTGTKSDGSPIFDLDKTPTRNQAVIMLVRLLGKEEEALAGTWELPFTDVEKGSTAYPYIGYAYANGLTNGTSATTYSGGSPIRANQYITFVLRAMGYESGTDFEVATAWTCSDELGITGGTYSAATKTFTRGDIALITLSALTCPLKGSETTLCSVIQENGGLAKGARYTEPQEMKYIYCNDWGEAVHYEESYCRELTVAKLGSLYQFKVALKPGCFYGAHFFPAGLQDEDEDSDQYSEKIPLLPVGSADRGSLFVDEAFFFENPICQSEMVLNLNPILSAFPEGCTDDCIMLLIRTADLPK